MIDEKQQNQIQQNLSEVLVLTCMTHCRIVLQKRLKKLLTQQGLSGGFKQFQMQTLEPISHEIIQFHDIPVILAGPPCVSNNLAVRCRACLQQQNLSLKCSPLLSPSCQQSGSQIFETCPGHLPNIVRYHSFSKQKK